METHLGLALPASVTRGPAATTTATTAATVTRTSGTVYSAPAAGGHTCGLVTDALRSLSHSPQTEL